ncbi:MAG TPA: hypothetical protein PLU72_07330 [Candidatus Ozemobacteraceae bacterium]|nr:hypothetical protein [Candidatus Ozemobacteraceae bacterium]
MVISTLHWWLAWLLFWAAAIPSEDGGFVNRRVWYFPKTFGTSGASPHGRWFEAVDSGVSNDSLNVLLIERARPGGTPLAGRLTPPLFKLLLADIDGNGTDDLIAGVERTIRGRVWKRVYVYESRHPDFPPLWLGSRLSFVLDDFNVVSVRGRPGLRAVERRYGRKVTSEYLWYTFGFRTVSSREDPTP